jgi:hypothetical protein
MSWLGGALQLGGAALGLIGSHNAAESAKDQAKDQAKEYKRAAEANSKISRYDAEVAENNALAEHAATVAQFKKHYYDTNRLLASQRASFAKAGVSVGTGTPVNVFGDTARRAYEDGQTILHEGQNAVERFKSQAKRFRMLADSGLRDAAAQASLLRSAASDRATGYYIQGATTFASNLYNFDNEFGIF